MHNEEYLEKSERTAGHLQKLPAPNAYGIVSCPQLGFELVNLMSSGMIADSFKRALWYGATQEDINNRFTDYKDLCHSLQEEFEYHSQDKRGFNEEELGVIHAALGLMSEAGEIIESVLKSYAKGKPLDYENLKEEFGDVAWYLAEGIRRSQSTFSEIFDSNIRKLEKRFPEKFSQENALNRDIEAEQKALKQA